MKSRQGRLIAVWVAGTFVLGAGTVVAQSAPEPGASTATRLPASAPAGASRGMAAWWGANVTPGWSLMTWGERNEHRQAMRTLKTHEECNVYLEKHHERMMERAKEHGKEPLPPIQHNACERLKP